MSGGPQRQISDLVSQPEDARVLKVIAEGTASNIGEAFFQSLAHHLADATGTRFAANWVIEGEGGTARILDMHPNTLRSRLKKLGIQRSDSADK